MPEVYKTPMVRMCKTIRRKYALTNPRMYESITGRGRKASGHKVCRRLWKSKIPKYEIPCSVTGIGKAAGSQRKPKGDNVTDNIFGTWEAGSVEILSSVKRLQGKYM